MTTTKDIPEQEVFCIVNEQRKAGSKFVYTPHQTEHVFCLGIKIKGRVYTSAWFSESEGKKGPVRAMRQVLYIKRNGWVATDETRLDDVMKMFREKVFRCAYCENTTTEVDGPCICRRVALSLAK